MDEILPATLSTRRSFLIGSGAAVSAAALCGRTGACVLSAEQEQGPYFLRKELVRQNIAEDRRGIPLQLRLTVLNANDCAPLPNAAIDIWHCDAEGEYSGFDALRPGGGPGGPGGPPPGPPPGRPRGDGPPQMHPSNKKTFLRGIQVTGEDGCAGFVTIYPGWYAGRTIHIHLKVNIGGHVSHTGQLFFPEEISSKVAALQPYANHRVHRVLQAEDHVFQDEHGSGSLVQLHPVSEGAIARGFIATVALGVDPKAVPAPVGFGGSPDR